MRLVPRDPSLLALAATLAAYAAFLTTWFAPALYNFDANGYYKQAHLILTRGCVSFQCESPVQFVGLNWVQVPSGDFHSKYPPGLPALIAVVLGTFGPRAGIALDAVLALVGVAGMYLLVRPRLGSTWAAVAAAALALNPIYTRHALFCDSQMAAAVLLIWALRCFDRWIGTGRTADLAWCGLLLGYLATVRYPEAMLVGAFVVGAWMTGRRPVRSLGVLLSAVAVPVIPLLVHNTLAYGAPWKTGYTLSGEQSAFSWHNLVENAGFLLGILQGPYGVSCFLELGLLGLGLLVCRRETRPLGACLALVALPLTLLYMAYGFVFRDEPPQNSARLFLTTFPVLIVAGCCFLEWLLRSPARARLRGVVAAAVLAQAAWGFSCGLPDLRAMHATTTTLTQVTRMVEATVPPGAVIVAPPPVHAHLDFLLRWRCAVLQPGVSPATLAMEAEKWSGQKRLFVLGPAPDALPWTQASGTLRLRAQVPGSLYLWEFGDTIRISRSRPGW